jgi:hypothetical protein
MAIPRFLIGLLLAASACGPSQSSEEPVPRAQRDVLTHEEIVNSPQDLSSLYSAIQALRPNFLASPMGIRPSTANKSVTIYVNGAIQTGLETLQAIPADHVEEVRYLEPMKAQSEFGPVASGGAVLVRLRKASADP